MLGCRDVHLMSLYCNQLRVGLASVVSPKENDHNFTKENRITGEEVCDRI